MSTKVQTSPLDELASQIRDAQDEVEAALTDAIYKAADIGTMLIEAKKLVAHGEWVPWIEANLPFGKTQATKYMRLGANPKLLAKVSSGKLLTSVNDAYTAIGAKLKPKAVSVEPAPKAVKPITQVALDKHIKQVEGIFETELNRHTKSGLPLPEAIAFSAEIEAFAGATQGLLKPEKVELAKVLTPLMKMWFAHVPEVTESIEAVKLKEWEEHLSDKEAALSEKEEQMAKGKIYRLDHLRVNEYSAKEIKRMIGLAHPDKGGHNDLFVFMKKVFTKKGGAK